MSYALRVVLGVRFCFPFLDSPLQHLFSDPMRHWDNGTYFLHPNLMGGQDPFLYQFWLYFLQKSAHFGGWMVVSGATGLLCALMPYGWYKALGELLPGRWALGGGIVIGLVPEFTAIYAYFMNETLLLTLTGFAVWLSLRAMRRCGVADFALACLFWLLAGFTRSIALPMGMATLGYLWYAQPHKRANAAITLALLATLAVPAGLHARQALHFFAPFGNFYFNDIYRASGKRDLALAAGAQGQYRFSCPSFHNPTFYPWSDWTTDTSGVVSIHIDSAHGRADWIAEKNLAARYNTVPFLQDMRENFLYLTFGQAWPDNDRRFLVDRLTVWSRWLWPPLILAVAYAAALNRFTSRAWLLPGLGLGMFLFLMVQRDCVMEGRFRTPIDPFFVAAAVVMAHRWRGRTPAAPQLPNRGT